MCPADALETDGQTDDEAEERPRLSLDGFPHLQALVNGPNGTEILEELEQLMFREPNRAPRYQRDLFARIRVSDDQPPEVGIVRDVSRSGVRLQLTASAHLDIMKSRTIRIEMRRPGTPFVSCEARLVRVIAHHKGGVELAFSFLRQDEHDPDLERLLSYLASEASAA